MVRAPCCSETGLKKGPWTLEEDQILIDHVQKHGHGSWRALPKRAGLNRCGKSCRLRWINYLKPDIKRGNFSEEEERTIINLHSVLGNKWSRIAVHLPGRTDNEIKNFWNTQLRKKLLKKGIDPRTHKPIPDFNLLSNLSKLQISLNMINYPVMNSWANASILHSDATNQLTRLQLLHNLQQDVNMSRFPKIEEEANNLAQLYEPTTKAIIEQSNMNIPSQHWHEFVDKDIMTVDPCGEYHAVTSFMANFGGGFRPQLLDCDDNCLINIPGRENSLRGLVSIFTPEASIVNQMSDMTPGCIATPSLDESNISEDWEKLIDDEAIRSFLKDIADSDMVQ